jgi:hypothetical protein
MSLNYLTEIEPGRKSGLHGSFGHHQVLSKQLLLRLVTVTGAGKNTVVCLTIEVVYGKESMV